MVAARTTPDDFDTDAEPLLLERGTAGLKHSYGIVREEFHRKLQGQDAVAVYTEMRDNSAEIGAALLSIENLLRGVEWWAEPASDSSEAQAEADYLDECMEDMEQTWPDFISEVLTMLPFGWSLFEEVYKIRRGEHEDIPQLHSSFSDGRIGWRNLAPRPQDTLLRWKLDPNGRALGMFQASEPDFRERYIDFKRALLFRPRSNKNNPEGRSLLRNSYRGWFKLKNTEDIEGVGIERDMAGYPVMQVPASWFSANASAEDKARLEKWRKMIQNVRRDAYEGVVIPSETLPNGDSSGFKLALLNSGGRRPVDTNEIIKRMSSRVLMPMHCEFLTLGQDNVGSHAMHSDKTTFFGNSMGAILDSISATLNRFAIPRLFRLNGVPRELWPKMKHGDLEKKDVVQTATVLTQLVQGGVLPSGTDVENAGRELVELPPIDENVPRPEPAEITPEQMAAMGVSPNSAMGVAPSATGTGVLA